MATLSSVRSNGSGRTYTYDGQRLVRIQDMTITDRRRLEEFLDTDDGWKQLGKYCSIIQ